MTTYRIEFGKVGDTAFAEAGRIILGITDRAAEGVR